MMPQGSKTSRQHLPWIIGAALPALLIALPLLVILFELFGNAEAWTRVFTTLKSEYIGNTFLLVVGVSILSLLMGVPTAWAVVRYRFWGSKFLSWALLLPLTIPAYILAITYAGIFDFTGPYQTFLRDNFSLETANVLSVDVMNPTGLIFILALALYPYVFIAARVAFSMQAANQIDAATTLGASRRTIFYRVALPLARPAIFGGLFLVIMEVLNDYGAMEYYGVPTFTTEIFRSWFSRADGLSLAVRLAAMLLVVVAVLIWMERAQRGKAGYHNEQKMRPLKPQSVSRGRNIWLLIGCSLPLLFGFLIPLMQLLSWSVMTAGKVMDEAFGALVLTSCLLAAGAALVVVILSVLFAYARRLKTGWLGKTIGQLAVIGYAIPGAIIAVGVMIPFAFIDRQIGELILTGSVVILLFAYTVRFMAVGFNGIEAAFGKVSFRLDESARMLGAGSGRTLFGIHLPMIRPALLAGLILVFVDVMKELPLTYILRPFNFDTLATRTYELASDEMVAEAANPALIIVLVGIIPIFLLHRFSNRSSWKKG